MSPILIASISFVLCAISIPLLIRISNQRELVSETRADRWNKRSVPITGGVGIFIAAAAAILLAGRSSLEGNWGLLLGAALMALLGFVDDHRELSPPLKFAGQIMVALVVVFSGYRTGFLDSEILNIIITVFWLVGITNALNLLDNMDGVAGGISLIAIGFMSFFFWRNGADADLLIFSSALFGALLGFLVFNFPPAKIFMGDSGSLFIGYSLASLAIARTPQASNVFAVLGVPALLFALPILDTTFVTITRLMRGQSPAKGGRDHTSHRLVAFGLSERQTVLVLYGVAILSGLAGAVLESFDYTLSLVLIPIMLVTFAVLAAYLSRLKVVETDRRDGAFTNFLHQLAFRRRLFEIALDFILISIAYYFAFWIRSGFTLTDTGLNALVETLPVIIGSTYVSFFLLGIYKRLWRFIGVRDLLRFSTSVITAVVISSIVLIIIFPRSSFSFGIQFLFAVFLFIAIAASRSSFRLLDEISQRQSTSSGKEATRVLIYDADDLGELAMRWFQIDPKFSVTVVGFLDDDQYKVGRKIHEVEVLGGSADAERIIYETNADRLIIVSDTISGAAKKAIKLACKNSGIIMQEFQVSLDED